MGKLKHSVLILGEGPTEFYYFNSLRDVVKGLTIKPDYPKHTSMKELEEKIDDGIKDGYDRIFCVIDIKFTCKSFKEGKLRSYLLRH